MYIHVFDAERIGSTRVRRNNSIIEKQKLVKQKIKRESL